MLIDDPGATSPVPATRQCPDVPQDLYDSYECVVYSTEAGDVIYLLFGHDERQCVVFRISIDDATRERIRARDLTDDEIRLLDLITVNCGLSWEVGGCQVIEYLQLNGDLPAFIELAESDIHAFCESVRYLTDNLETNAAGELVVRDPPPESDDGSRLLKDIITDVDLATETARINRDELNDREHHYRNQMPHSPGAGWLGNHGLSGGIRAN
jgi:hypothetical protein